MPLNLHNLDEKTRKYMSDEIERDLRDGRLYLSPRLTEDCAKEYPQLLKAAAGNGNDETLAKSLATTGRLKTHETRTTKNGTTLVKVPVTAAETLGEGEFNRFYMRGLCARAIAEGGTRLVVYRAKQVTNSRPESEILIGTAVEAEQLLNDLRTHIGTDTALGLPQGPNSGLSVRFS